MNGILRFVAQLLQRLLRTIDLPLLAALAALMGIGLATLYSASNESTRMLTTQGAYFGIGLGGLWLASRLPAHVLKQLTPPIYAASLLPLVLVLFVGSGKYGNHWINLGLFNFQPSELAKLTLPMMLAWHLDRSRLPPAPAALPMAALIIALPVGLILLQRDLGTAVLVLASGVFVLFLAGLSWWWFAIAGSLGIAGFSLAMFAPITWFSFLRPYQQNRILTFRDPENDPMGAGWNILQSKIAIGGGGLTGKGWTEGTQSHLDYVPEHTTDFVFSVLSEEWGWLGVATVLALYLAVVGRCLWIAIESRDGYARLLAGALGLSLFAYVLTNAAMVSGLLPVVGVPMPLLSRGGTSSVILLAGFGVVMALGARRTIHR
jgi:rod shape determining protein RodA